MEEGQNFRRKLRKWMKMDMKQIRSYVVTGQAWGVKVGKKKYTTCDTWNRLSGSRQYHIDISFGKDLCRRCSEREYLRSALKVVKGSQVFS